MFLIYNGLYQCYMNTPPPDPPSIHRGNWHLDPPPEPVPLLTSVQRRYQFVKKFQKETFFKRFQSTSPRQQLRWQPYLRHQYHQPATCFPLTATLALLAIPVLPNQWNAPYSSYCLWRYFRFLYSSHFLYFRLTKFAWSHYRNCSCCCSYYCCCCCCCYCLKIFFYTGNLDTHLPSNIKVLTLQLAIGINLCIL